MAGAAFALRVATVPQETPADFGLTVREMDALGRLPHRRSTFGLDEADRMAIDVALARVDVGHQEARGVGTLSGGERQRVMVARTRGGDRVLRFSSASHTLRQNGGSGRNERKEGRLPVAAAPQASARSQAGKGSGSCSQARGVKPVAGTRQASRRARIVASSIGSMPMKTISWRRVSAMCARLQA